MVAQPVDFGLPGRVRAQHVEDVARLVDRVTPHPRARGVRPLARGGDLGAQRALASSLDLAGAGLHQDREVAGEQFRAVPAEPQQPVAFGGDLLAVVEDVRNVPDGRGEVRGQPQLHRYSGFHVRGAAAVEAGSLGARGNVAGQRHRVDVPGQDHPFRPPEFGPRHDRVAVAADVQVRQQAQRGLDRVRQRAFFAADRGNVNKLRGQRRAVKIQVQVHRASLGRRPGAAGGPGRHGLGRGAQRGQDHRHRRPAHAGRTRHRVDVPG